MIGIKTRISFFLILLIFAMLSLSPGVAAPVQPAVAAPTFFVSPAGSDGNSGSETQPWKTIQKAANAASPGSTVNIKGGTYHERVSINVSGSAAAGYITFRNHGNERVILDGAGTAVSDQEDMILIKDKQFIQIEGLEICDNTCNSRSLFPKGIEITGHDDSIQLRHLKIHNIQNTNTSQDSGANAIGVYGSDTKPITHLLVDDVEVWNCKLGQSETVTFNGNVDGYVCSNCFIHDNDNIGICNIGWEKTCPDASQDQARNGQILNNRVDNCSSEHNPTYHELSADGIYSDGAHDTVFARNTITNCDIGIEIASEHKDKTTTNMLVRDNVIYNNKATGISIGGYDTKRGWAIHCKIINNTLYHNDSRKALRYELDLCKCHDNVIENNIICGNDQNAILGNDFNSTYCYNNLIDHNIYWAPAGPEQTTWVWLKKDYKGFDAYRKTSVEDAHSQFADPRFANPDKNDFRVLSNSPAAKGAQVNCGASQLGVANVPQ